jgi:hypothetical protein
MTEVGVEWTSTDKRPLYRSAAVFDLRREWEGDPQ